ncbi:MAG TPA: alpha/beta fold hydrolase [Chthoniobacterales bacterium]|nr:alpha/beta fold hydrolase [Chthoniobacterales bacterium]
MKSSYLRLIARFAGVLVLADCAPQIAVVSEKAPSRFQATSGTDQAVTKTIDRAQGLARSQPLVALEAYASAARDSLRELDRNPADREARRCYNFAVAGIFSVVRTAKLDPWSQPLGIGANSELTLTGRKDPAKPEQNPALFDLIPTDELRYHGAYVKDDVTKDGIGAPLVAIRHLTEEEAAALFTAPVIYYGVTGFVEFEGKRCVLSIRDPLAAETVTVDAHTYPMAANFTASLAMVLAQEKPQKLGLVRLLRPEKYAATARVARMEPYDPNKSVVLFVHGLMDTPATWVPMLNELRADKEIRANYQFWFYSYPSGYPYPYSALILRQELDAIERRYPLRKPMVVVGHSMGGCITRTLITDAGTKLWIEGFGKPPEKTEMPEQSKRLLEQALIFKHRPEIGRVIFMSTPHRGSDLASNWMGRIGSMLVKTPVKLLTVGRTIRESLTADPAALQLKRLPNSVDTLAPSNRFVVAINQIPITPGIPYYTIVGDRGKGDTPNSSDGVVAYWSSHLDGATAERIVPSNHSSPLNPEAIAEVHRILKLNARSQ